MKKLGRRNYSLLEIGIKQTGSYVEAYHVVEESILISEGDIIYKFLNWVQDDVDNRRFGHGNYEQRFAEFLEYEKSAKKLTSTLKKQGRFK